MLDVVVFEDEGSGYVGLLRVDRADRADVFRVALGARFTADTTDARRRKEVRPKPSVELLERHRRAVKAASDLLPEDRILALGFAVWGRDAATVAEQLARGAISPPESLADDREGVRP